jgi:cell wall-associated NlpC family hydrolase
LTGAVIARSAVVPLQREPSLRSEQVSQLVLGETAAVEEGRGEWRRVVGEHDDYAGWAHAGYLLEVEPAAAARWRDAATGWSLGAVLRVDGLLLRVPLRARLALEGDGVRLPDGRYGSLAEGAVPNAAEVAARSRGQSARRWALEHFAGAPYQWGGVTPWGVDCSGLVQTAYAARGERVLRDSTQQAGIGQPVALDAFTPGDLLFFRGEESPHVTHVAFADDADTLIHSTVSCGGVVHESWLPGTRGSVLRERLVAVRRVEGRG